MAQAPPADHLPTAEYWTYKVLSKDYTAAELNPWGGGVAPNTFGPTAANNPLHLVTDRTRRIPIQSLPQGALLFHYFKLPTRNVGENDNSFQHRILDVFFGQFGIPITWQAATQRWKFCFGTVVTNYHYYYPNPCAGFGIDGYGNTFNAAIVCRTTRSSKWAYLKAGSSIRNDRVNHRRFPITSYRNYDYKRIKICADIVNNGACRPGQDYDICLTPEFQRDNRVDGITSLAQMDDLMDIRKNAWGAYTYDTNKTMFRTIQSFWSKVQQHGNQEVDHLLWDMNLLCLESDYKPDSPRLNVGFREFANSPFGHEQRNPARIPPHDLPAAFGTINVNYWIAEEQYEGGQCVKRVFEIDEAHVTAFFQQYIRDHLLLLPEKVVTPWAALAPGDPVALAPYIGNVEGGADPPELRYNLNNRMAHYLNEISTANSLYFDVRLNIFFRAVPAPNNNQGYNGAANVNIMFDFFHQHAHRLPAAHPLKNPPHRQVGYSVGMYAKNVQNTRVNRVRLMVLKYLHELISNVKWSDYWMYEISFDLSHTAPDFSNSLTMPIGPFYNPFSLPITNYNDIPTVFRQIIRNLENTGGIGVVDHSGLHNILENPGQFQYIQRWAQNANYLNFNPPAGVLGHGNTFPYFTGYFFRDLLNANLITVPEVHEGGKQKTRKQRGGRMASVVSNRRTLKNTNFLSDKNFRKNLQMNLLKSNRKTNKRTSMNKNTNTNTNIRNKKKEEEEEGGHTSDNMVPMELDTFETFQKMFVSPTFGPLLKLMFAPTTATNAKTNHEESQSELNRPEEL